MVGISADEMHIRHGTEHIREQAILAGLASGPVKEKDVKSLDVNEIPKKLAKCILAVFITTLDGKTAVPYANLPTTLMTGPWFFEQVSIYFIKVYVIILSGI